MRIDPVGRTPYPQATPVSWAGSGSGSSAAHTVAQRPVSVSFDRLQEGADVDEFITPALVHTASPARPAGALQADNATVEEQRYLDTFRMDGLGLSTMAWRV
jgi:hypothetical protein